MLAHATRGRHASVRRVDGAGHLVRAPHLILLPPRHELIVYTMCELIVCTVCGCALQVPQTHPKGLADALWEVFEEEAQRRRVREGEGGHVQGSGEGALSRL